MLLIREAADCQRKRKYNIWKHVIDAHYILCYSIIELSFMHSTLYREMEWIFGVFFCCQKFQNPGKGSKYNGKELLDNSKKI